MQSTKGRKRQKPRHTYGEWLHELRTRRGLTQQEVAEELAKRTGKRHIPTSTVGYWESTGDLGGRFTIPALADVLGVTIETLLRVERMPNGKYARTDWNPRKTADKPLPSPSGDPSKIQ